jgi:hypothetical protein
LFFGYKVLHWVVRLLWSQVVRSWYVLGRLGGFNSMNMQVCFLSFSPQLNLMHPVNLLLKSWKNYLSMEEHAVYSCVVVIPQLVVYWSQCQELSLSQNLSNSVFWFCSLHNYP